MAATTTATSSAKFIGVYVLLRHASRKTTVTQIDRQQRLCEGQRDGVHACALGAAVEQDDCRRTAPDRRALTVRPVDSSTTVSMRSTTGVGSASRSNSAMFRGTTRTRRSRRWHRSDQASRRDGSRRRAVAGRVRWRVSGTIDDGIDAVEVGVQAPHLADDGGDHARPSSASRPRAREVVDAELQHLVTQAGGTDHQASTEPPRWSARQRRIRAQHSLKAKLMSWWRRRTACGSTGCRRTCRSSAGIPRPCGRSGRR